MHKDRLRLAMALGYYASATSPDNKLSAAVAFDVHTPNEYRTDIDYQVAFSKGFLRAQEDLQSRSYEASELGRLSRAIATLIGEVTALRAELQNQRDSPYRWQAPLPSEKPSEVGRVQASINALNMQAILRVTGKTLDEYGAALGMALRPHHMSDDAFRTEMVAFINTHHALRKASGSGAGGEVAVYDNSGSAKVQAWLKETPVAPWVE